MNDSSRPIPGSRAVGPVAGYRLCQLSRSGFRWRRSRSGCCSRPLICRRTVRSCACCWPPESGARSLWDGARRLAIFLALRAVVCRLRPAVARLSRRLGDGAGDSVSRRGVFPLRTLAGERGSLRSPAGDAAAARRAAILLAILAFMYRFLFVLWNELDTMRAARRARTFDQAGLIFRWRIRPR